VIGSVLATLMLQAAPSAPAAEPVRPALRRLVVDPQASEVGFDGSSTLHDFTARTRQVAGEVRFDPGHLALAGGTISCQAAALDSGSEGRDEDMRETLEVERFPEIRFVLGSASGTWSNRQCSLALTGRFAVHGVERESKLAVDVETRSDGGLHLVGKVKLSLDDFRLDPPSVLFVNMDDEVKVWFDLVLLPAPGDWKPAVSRSLELVEEHFDEKGSSLGRTTETERLWIEGDRFLWERRTSAQWIVVRPAFATDLPRRGFGTLVLDLSRGTWTDEVASAEELFEDAGVAAPDFGSRDWLQIDGLKGQARFFARLLLAAPGLPRAVRDELDHTEGTPESVRFTTIEPGGSCNREIRLGPEEPGSVPAWAFDFQAWLAGD
jgi:polyisoprenoid-binding protein YceI